MPYAPPDQPQALQRLLAERAILRVVSQLNLSIDTLDQPLLLSLLHPTRPFTFDLSSHHAHVPPQTMTPAQYWAATVRALAGFTATQHDASNPLFEWPEEDETTGKGNELTTVRFSGNVVAYHCIQAEDGGLQSVTAHAVQELGLQLWEGRWVLTYLGVRRCVPLDNPGLYGVAAERAEKGVGRMAVPRDEA